jgi:diacylglycerol kinase family enzyme
VGGIDAGHKLAILASLAIGTRVAFGGVDLLESTSYFQTEAFTVHANREVPVEVDGEWIGRFSEVRFVETASRLRVLAPEGPVAGNFAEVLKSMLQWPRRQPELQTTRSL